MKPIKFFVDTSFWCALYDVKDKHHREAKDLWGALADLPVQLFTSDYIFDETVTVVKRRMNYRAAVELGEAILQSEVLTMWEVTPGLREESWRLFKLHADKGYSFTDCTSFVLMQTNAFERALAFNHHFAQMGFVVRHQLKD